jgi:enoyl-CoA hydratase/carnithine racemase
MSHSSANATYPNAQIKATFPSPGVLLLTLARPPVNAFNNSLWFELGASFDVASVDPEVRAVVLNSDLEKVFTAGLDLGCVPSPRRRSSLVADAAGYVQGESVGEHAGYGRRSNGPHPPTGAFLPSFPGSPPPT